MTLNVSFAPEAREELFEAADYYESESRGLGASFLATVDRALEQLTQKRRPYSWWGRE